LEGDTLPGALQIPALNGHIAFIGTLSGTVDAISTGAPMRAGTHLSAVYVGSRADFEAMTAFVSKYKIHPLIDRVCDFEQAPAACDYMAHVGYLGRFVIRVAR